MDDAASFLRYPPSNLPPSGRFPSPQFPFPFSPFGFGLFDADPSKILSLLHHQSMLAEEALRYRNLFTVPKESVRYNPAELFPAKETQSKRPNYIKLSNNNLRFPFNPSAELLAHMNTSTSSSPATSTLTTSTGSSPGMASCTITRSASSTPFRSDLDGSKIIDLTDKRSESEYSRKSDSSAVLSYTGMEELKNPKEVLDEILLKRTATSPGLDQPHSSMKSPTPSSSSCSTVSHQKEVLVLQDGTTIEEETKCDVCGAVFPSVWLLEQHAALQHAGSGDEDEKPFICEQCGQSYRYRSAYLKHREQNHRARLPADKLFTCDVCGMQFRYLKSFKKHRLNHALERLHGKHDRKGLLQGRLSQENSSSAIESGSEVVTSSNDVEESDLKIKEEVGEGEDVQDETIDSGGGICSSTENKDMDLEMQSSAESNPLFQLMGQQQPLPTTSVNSLLSADQIPSDQALGLNAQEASILNFLRIDAAERQRDRRFACPFCGKCVRSKENLKLHVRKHTGERPFVCLFCGRAFGGKSDLTRHLRIHTGERPYHCEACGKCFARADYLSKHLTTHIHNGPR